jgi:hypothetical protein
MSDRLCIHTNGSINVVLSPEQLVSCSHVGNMGCNGGIPLAAWGYIAVSGLVADSCFPYTAGNGTAAPCTNKCVDGEEWKAHKVALTSIRSYGNEEAIKTAIFTEGPVEATLEVYEDFMNYSSGIYQHTSGKLLGGHAIKMVGWGEENGTPYWTLANSWSESWGEQGYFRIIRGKNECGIESGCTAARPVESTLFPSVTPDADSKLCTACKSAADAIVNKLINLVFQGTVVGGCADLCSHLPKNVEKEICDGICVLAGEAAFEQAIAHAQFNPEQLCYLVHACKN